VVVARAGNTAAAGLIGCRMALALGISATLPILPVFFRVLLQRHNRYCNAAIPTPICMSSPSGRPNRDPNDSHSARKSPVDGGHAAQRHGAGFLRPGRAREGP